MTLGCALFPTALGSCAIAWSERGVYALQLPEASPEQTLERLREKTGAAPSSETPAGIREAIALLTRHLGGEPQDLRKVPIDWEGIPPFHRKACEAAREIAPGQTLSYSKLAERAGSPRAARAVGQAMRLNRLPLIVPCHRVLASDGALVGFSAAGGLQTKQRLLELEGVSVQRQRSLFEGGHELPFDPREAVRALREADPKLAALIDQVGPLRLKLEAMSSPFESLAEAIVYQQLSGKAAATILGRLHAQFGDRPPTPEELLAAPDEQLRSAGLSRPKVAALRDLAQKAREGLVPDLEALERMSDEEIVERLTAVRGIGRWTVEMLLIFRLGRPDVLPINDLGIRKGMARMLGQRAVPEPDRVARRGERWRPYRTAASWYLWRALDG